MSTNELYHQPEPAEQIPRFARNVALGVGVVALCVGEVVNPEDMTKTGLLAFGAAGAFECIRLFVRSRLRNIMPNSENAEGQLL